MGGALAAQLSEFVIKLAVQVLKYYQERADFKELVERELENAGLKRVAEAARWAVESGASGADLRMRQPKRGQQTRPGAPPPVP